MSRYTSRHTGATIDDAVDRAKSGGAIDISLANKAPAGFGLGNAGKLITDCNAAGLNGWYHIEAGGLNSPDSSMGWTILVTTPYNEATPIQDAFTYINTTVYYHLRRFVYPGGGTPWEWVDPPMHEGVEYRTTERYQGKPVYVKNVNCGVAPETGYIIAYPVIDNIESVIEAVPMVGSGTLPTIRGSTANYEVVGAVQSYQVDNKYAKTVIEHNGDTTNSVIVRLRYTKTTD